MCKNVYRGQVRGGLVGGGGVRGGERRESGEELARCYEKHSYED